MWCVGVFQRRTKCCSVLRACETLLLAASLFAIMLFGVQWALILSCWVICCFQAVSALYNCWSSPVLLPLLVAMLVLVYIVAYFRAATRRFIWPQFASKRKWLKFCWKNIVGFLSFTPTLCANLCALQWNFFVHLWKQSVQMFSRRRGCATQTTILHKPYDRLVIIWLYDSLVYLVRSLKWFFWGNEVIVEEHILLTETFEYLTIVCLLWESLAIKLFKKSFSRSLCLFSKYWRAC